MGRGSVFDVRRAEPAPVRILGWDCETAGRRRYEADLRRGIYRATPHKFRLGVVYDGERHHVFRDPAEMRHWFGRQPNGTTAWATNLEYDLSALYPDPVASLERVRMGSILKSARLVTGWRTDRRGRRVPRSRVLFLDTMNHWPAGVRALGKMLGLPKMVAPWDGDPPDEDEPVTDEEVEYCCRDAEVSYLAMARIQEVYLSLGCRLCATSAASSLDLFARRYMDDRHVHVRPPPAVLGPARASYVGGRTEAFRLGRIEGPVSIGDVNSMYPWVMSEVRLPILGFRDSSGRVRRVLPDVGRSIPEDREGVVKATVRVPDQEYPPLPFRSDKVYFPIGEWTGWFTLLELRHALARGAVEVVRVRKVLSWPDRDRLFADFVRDVYGMRCRAKRAGDAVMEKALKIVLNGLYGKFGTTSYPTAFCSRDMLQNPVDEALARLRGVEPAREIGTSGWWREERTGEGLPPHANVVWASYVTAGARCRLHDLLVEWGGIYCDTDSAATLRRDVPIASELGEFGLEATVPWIEIRGPKNYVLGTEDGHPERKLKGVPRRALYDLDDDGGVVGLRPEHELPPDPRLEREAAERGIGWVPRPRSYVFQRVVRHAEGLRQGVAPNTWRDAQKIVTGWSDKRCYAADGSSRPWDVAELEAWHGPAEVVR